MLAAMAKGSRSSARPAIRRADGRRVRTGAATAIGTDGLLASMTQPRVQVGIEHVDQQVRADDDGRAEDDDGFNQWKIVILHRLDCQLANPRPAKDGLDDDGVA